MNPLKLLIICAGLTLTANAQKLNQSSVRGLLVIQLPSGKHAGAASQMNATVVPTKEKNGFKIKFNQKVGPMMSSSVREVTKFLSVRHPNKLPKSKMIELSFADRHSPKDGPSAAVACALLGNSIISGEKLDPKFAVTGDMTATGSVQPVGGVEAKIRGAINRGDSQIVAIPIKKQTSIEDLYITEGIEKLYKIQIFTIENFEEARKIAITERDDKTAEAIAQFALVQKALNNNENYIKNPKVKAKLREVYNASPNCISAKLLLLHAVGKGPKRLSPGGSLNALNVASAVIGESLDNGSFKNMHGNSDIIFKTLSKLQRIRTKLDKRTIENCDALLNIGQWIKQRRNDKVLSAGDIKTINGLINKLRQEENKLRNNTKFMEELMN